MTFGLAVGMLLLWAVPMKQSSILEVEYKFDRRPHLGKPACVVGVWLDARGVCGDGTTRDWADRLFAGGLHRHWSISPCAGMYTQAQHRTGKTFGVICWKDGELLLLGRHLSDLVLPTHVAC